MFSLDRLGLAAGGIDLSILERWGSGGATLDSGYVGSVQADGLLRRVEREGGDMDEEILAAFRLHLVVADHEARGGRERAATRVFEALARREHRLLADDTRTAHLLKPPEAVGDTPVALPQLHRLVPAILDLHVVGPDIVVIRGRGVLLEIERFHRDFDRAGGFGIHTSNLAVRADASSELPQHRS